MSSPRLLKVDNLPKSPKFDVHVWADFVELLCLVNIDKTTTRGDVLDRVRTLANDLPEGINPDEDDLAVDEELGDLAPAEVNDKWVEYAEEWFLHLLYRVFAFDERYPFTLANSLDALQLKENLTPDQKLYIFLLLCANLRYCKGSMSALTQAFEQLSARAMKGYFSGNAEVHVFGTSAESGGRYSGSLFQKIQKLAEDLGETVLISEAALPRSDAGDGGLDIVGWVPLGDINSHRIVIFGQCACTSEWNVKQYSSTEKRWRQMMTIGAGANSVVFIPHCLRLTDGEWHRIGDIASVMVDRQRFMFSLNDKAALLEREAAHAIVQTALAESEDIF